MGGSLVMTVTRFASVEAAAVEIDKARRGGHLQAAIGLARLAATQFPRQSQPHLLLAELYRQTGQPSQARREEAAASSLGAGPSGLAPGVSGRELSAPPTPPPGRRFPA